MKEEMNNSFSVPVSLIKCLCLQILQYPTGDSCRVFGGQFVKCQGYPLTIILVADIEVPATTVGSVRVVARLPSI